MSIAAIEATPVVAATFDVTTTADSGAGSLRQALLDANATPGADVIDFLLGSGPQTITLTSGNLFINSNIDIIGPGADLLTIDGNRTSNVFQVGTLYGKPPTVTISGLTIANGSANNLIDNARGGGIYSRGNLIVTNSTLRDNTAGNGGGIYSDGTLVVTNSTLSGNRANPYGSGGGGGGIFDFGTATITNSTISGNSTSPGGGFGGGIWDFNSTARIGNTIIAKNIGDRNPLDGPDVYGNFTSLGYNLIGISNGSTGFGVAGDIVGTTASPVDPKLGPLANNGGPTQTQALLPGSPAIDAGNNSLNPPGITTDQRGPGFVRIANSTVDIGAFEVQARSVPEPASTPGLLAFGSLFGAGVVLKSQLKKQF